MRTLSWVSDEDAPCLACRGTGGRMGKLMLTDDYFRCFCPFAHSGEKRTDRAEREARINARLARNGLSEAT